MTAPKATCSPRRRRERTLYFPPAVSTAASSQPCSLAQMPHALESVKPSGGRARTAVRAPVTTESQGHKQRAPVLSSWSCSETHISGPPPPLAAGQFYRVFVVPVSAPVIEPRKPPSRLRDSGPTHTRRNQLNRPHRTDPTELLESSRHAGYNRTVRTVPIPPSRPDPAYPSQSRRHARIQPNRPDPSEPTGSRRSDSIQPYCRDPAEPSGSSRLVHTPHPDRPKPSCSVQFCPPGPDLSLVGPIAESLSVVDHPKSSDTELQGMRAAPKR